MKGFSKLNLTCKVQITIAEFEKEILKHGLTFQKFDEILFLNV